MARRIMWVVAAWGVVLIAENQAWAQPSRQLPGVAPLLKVLPQPPQGGQTPPNPRVRPAANQTGLESTDFYPKRGYPRFLGDAVELGDVGGAAGGQVGQSGVAGQTGNTGVAGMQGNVFGGGFQGNIGNQIGQNLGGTIFGGIFGGNGGGGGIGGGFQGFKAGNGLSGGGFTGVTPKGFGFGGVPQ